MRDRLRRATQRARANEHKEKSPPSSSASACTKAERAIEQAADAMLAAARATR